MSTWGSYFFKAKGEPEIIPKDITPVDMSAKFVIKPISSSPLSGSSLSPTKTAAPGPFPKPVVAVQATTHQRSQSNTTPAKTTSSSVAPIRSQSTTTKKGGLFGFRAAIEPIAENEQVSIVPNDASQASVQEQSMTGAMPLDQADAGQMPTRKASNATKLATLFNSNSVPATTPVLKIEVTTAPKMPKFSRAAEIEKGASSEREVFKAPKHLPPPSPGLKRPLNLRDAVKAVVSQPKILKVVDDAIVAEEDRRMADFERRHEQIQEEKERLDLARETMELEQAKMQAEVDRWASEEAEMLEYMTAVGIKVSSVLPKALIVDLELEKRNRESEEKLLKERETQLAKDNLQLQQKQQMIENADAERKKNMEEQSQKEMERQMAEDNLRFLQKKQQAEDEKTKRRNARNAAEEALRREEELYAREQAQRNRLSSNPSNYESTRSSAVVDETPDLESDLSDYEDDGYDDILLGYDTADTNVPLPSKDKYRISFDIGTFEENERLQAKAEYDADKLRHEQQEEEEKLRYQMEEANRKMEEANRMLEEAKEYDRHRREEKARAERERVLKAEEQQRQKDKAAREAAERENLEILRREEEQKRMIEEEKREANKRKEQRLQGERVAEQQRRVEEARFEEQRQQDRFRETEEEQQRRDAQERYEEEQRRESTQVRLFVAEEDKLFADDQRRMQEESLKKQALFWQQRKLEAEAAKRNRDNSPRTESPAMNNPMMREPDNTMGGPPDGFRPMMSAPQNVMRTGPPMGDIPMSYNPTGNGPVMDGRAPMGNRPPMRPMGNGPPMRMQDNGMRNGPPMNNNTPMGNRPPMGNNRPPMGNGSMMRPLPPSNDNRMMRPPLASDNFMTRPLPPPGNDAMMRPSPNSNNPLPRPPPSGNDVMMRAPPMNSSPPPRQGEPPVDDEAFDKEEAIRKAEEKIQKAFAAMAGGAPPPAPAPQSTSNAPVQAMQPRPSIRGKSPFPPRAEKKGSVGSISSQTSMSRIETSLAPSDAGFVSPTKSDFSVSSSVKSASTGQRGKVGAFPVAPRQPKPSPPPKERSPVQQQQDRPAPPMKEPQMEREVRGEAKKPITGRKPPPRGGLPSGPKIGLPSGPKMRR